MFKIVGYCSRGKRGTLPSSSASLQLLQRSPRLTVKTGVFCEPPVVVELPARPIGSTGGKRHDGATLAECCLSHGFRHFDDQLFHLLCNSSGVVPISRLLKGLKNAGLWKNDPRLVESMNKINEHRSQLLHGQDGQGEVQLDREKFIECIKDNVVLIKRAFTGDFAIPEFSKFCSSVDSIYWACRTNSEGKVASYIPQLGKYSPDYWGVSLCTVDGQRHSIGDVEVPFTLQSSGKPINYALAINELGADFVHQYVGHEPSGESFNCIKLSSENKPHNPMINAGAILIASLIRRNLSLSDRFDFIMNQYRRMMGGEFIGFNNAIFLSEKETANRNYSLAYYLKENRCFPEKTRLDDTLDLYFQLCSMETNVNSGAVLAATLANGGYCPITGEEVLSATSVRNTLSLMHSCGMYDYSGGFAFKVGLPAKSSVSGAVLLVIPNVMGMCLWSPPLESMGNSVRGVQFCEQLVNVFNFHHYDNLRHTSQKVDPRMRYSDVQGNRIVNLLFGAYNGDLTALRRIALASQDMSIADYDGRTALHLAAAEGHLECVRFLVENCSVPVYPKDRWGYSPLDDATRFKRSEVQQYLQEFSET